MEWQKYLKAYYLKQQILFPMKEFNYKIICDNNKKSITVKKQLLNSLKNNFSNTADLIIVIGGDGFMLRTLKKYNGKGVAFYGINTGNYGFLLNKFSKKNIQKKIANAKMVSINPLSMIVKNNKGIVKKFYAINEVYILRQSKQASYLSVIVNKKTLIKKLISDGIIISTPAGSTAYNMSVHGPILNLDSKKISIVPISPFRPRRWKGKILSENSKIRIKNLSLKKRPIIAVADNHEVKNIKKIIVKIEKKISFKLLFDKDKSLQNKIKLEQLRKET